MKEELLKNRQTKEREHLAGARVDQENLRSAIMQTSNTIVDHGDNAMSECEKLLEVWCGFWFDFCVVGYRTSIGFAFIMIARNNMVG